VVILAKKKISHKKKRATHKKAVITKVENIPPVEVYHVDDHKEEVHKEEVHAAEIPVHEPEKKPSAPSVAMNSNLLKNMIIGILAVVVIALAILLGSTYQWGAESTSDKTNLGPAGQVLASVNGEPIYANDVLAIYESVPMEARTNTTIQQAFEQAINNKLLLQEARRKGTSISQEELDAAMNSFLATNGLTLQALQQALAQSNMTLEQFRSELSETLMVQKEVLDLTKDAPIATDTEVRQYYDTFKANITSTGSSVTRQLTVYANSSTSDERLDYIKQIASGFNGTNLCSLIKTYSEDALTVNSCGLYNTTQGQLLPEYEEAVYASTAGDVKIVGTRVGYHLVLIESVSPPKQLTFEESKDAIASYVGVLKKQQVLNQRLAELRQDAKIETYATE
jgi:parvulin-like peptidyl-prolyl isomerase